MTESWLVSFVRRHFGGIPRSLKDLNWIIQVNPNSVGSAPQATEYRTQAPGSQETYEPPHVTKYSKFYYFNRDTRRSFPQSVVYTESELARISAGGLLPQRIADSANTTATPTEPKAVPATTSTDPLPPIINNRYKYKPSPHLKPDADNPDFSIHSVQ